MRERERRRSKIKRKEEKKVNVYSLSLFKQRGNFKIRHQVIR